MATWIEGQEVTNPFFDRIVVGDVRASLKRMPEKFVNTCVTSPPYYGLRNYGTPSQVWGGDPDCRHANWDKKDFCAVCDAWRGHLGLEPSLDLFVAHLVEVFREVKRVLRDDGTLWLNLGDSYGTSGGETHSGFNERYHGTKSKADKQAKAHSGGVRERKINTGLAPKNLLGMPWRVAFALQADGWILRSDIIWEKPNVMPSSVTDRCTTSHEYMFMFAKSAKYHYDGMAIKEPAIYANDYRKGRGKISYDKKRKGEVDADGFKATGQESFCAIVDKRNKRTVWTVPTKPLKAAHFASFPPALITPCVLAGAPLGGVVLDPFMGSGTTGLVATNHGRRYVGCELNAEYAEMANERIMNESLGSLV